MSRLSASIRQLEAPYLATCYRVYLPTATEDVRIGEPAPAVDAWLAEHEAETAAILTACNPGSRLLGTAANRRLQAALLHLLHAMPHPMLPGCNIAEEGGWPDEHSLIVAGLSRAWPGYATERDRIRTRRASREAASRPPGRAATARIRH